MKVKNTTDSPMTLASSGVLGPGEEVEVEDKEWFYMSDYTRYQQQYGGLEVVVEEPSPPPVDERSQEDKVLDLFHSMTPEQRKDPDIMMSSGKKGPQIDWIKDQTEIHLTPADRDTLWELFLEEENGD